MAFGDPWNLTDPDGSVITVSQLDDSQRLIKRAVTERLEGDPAAPDLTGLIEVGSFAAAPKPRKGAARIYVDSQAAILALDATKREDGRLGVTLDSAHLFHAATGSVREITYVHRDTGPQEIRTVHTFKPAATSGAQTISVVAAAGTFTRAAGSYILDGFAAGETVAFSGFVNGGNNVAKVIQSVTATVITVTDISGLVSETGSGDEVATVTVSPPFLMGTSASGQLVPGLNADQVDGQHGSFTKVVGGNNAAVTHTGNVVETTVKTLTVPGGSMKANGWLRVKVFFQESSTVGQTSIKVKLGGTTFAIVPLDVASHFGFIDLWIANINSESVNDGRALAHRSGSVDLESVSRAVGTVDTSVNQDVIVTIQLGNSGDQTTVSGFLVEVMPVA